VSTQIRQTRASLERLVVAGTIGGALGAVGALLIDDWHALRLMPATECVFLPVSVHIANRRAGKLRASVLVAYLSLTASMLLVSRWSVPQQFHWAFLSLAFVLQLWAVIAAERRTGQTAVE